MQKKVTILIILAHQDGINHREAPAFSRAPGLSIAEGTNSLIRKNRSPNQKAKGEDNP